MKRDILIYAGAVLLCTASLLTPSKTHAARDSFNLSINNDAETCADLRVTSNNGEVAKVAESFSMTPAEAPLLELNGGDRGNIRVRGWDRQDYSVEICKVAVAATQAEAEQIARSISVTRAAGRVSHIGPSSDRGQWTAVFLIHTPKNATVALEATNGPISVRDLNGNVKARAVNGPIALRDCGGNVDARTTNGPISFSGDRGEVHLIAQNGPIAVKIQSEAWNGPQLEARTINGPLSVSVPDNFRSGVRLETSGHAPLSCNASLCRSAFTDLRGNNRTLQMNGANDTIRLSTENGPVAVSSSRLDATVR